MFKVKMQLISDSVYVAIYSGYVPHLEMIDHSKALINQHHLYLRPDLNEVLFLRSIPYPFQRVERNGNKIKRENKQKIAKLCLIKKNIIFCFTDFSQLFCLMINVQEYLSNNKSIESGPNVARTLIHVSHMYIIYYLTINSIWLQSVKIILW